MSIKILTQNGVENTNIDGARDSFFNSGKRDGIVEGILNEGIFSSVGNTIYLDTCELRIAGHRILIDEPYSQSFANAPSSSVRYSLVAQIEVDDNKNVSFEFLVQEFNFLVKNDLYKNINGSGKYQVEIGRFTLSNNGTINDVSRIIEVITGGSGTGGSGIIVGEVNVETLDAGVPAEVIMTNRYDPQTKQNVVDFQFGIPQGETGSQGEKGDAGKDINVNEFVKEFTAGASQDKLSAVVAGSTKTSPLTQRQRACCYGNGYYVIAGTGGELAYSQDGVNWTKVTAFTTEVIAGLAYGNGYFLAVDDGGNIFRTDIPSNEWVLVYTGASMSNVRYINNHFASAGDAGLIAFSLDGKDWVEKTTNITNDLKDIAYGNGRYVAGGVGGAIITSINGEIWYDQTSDNLTTDIRAVMYANGQFVIGTSGGRIDYSKDGITWATANNPSSSTISWIRNFSYFDNRLYAVMYTSSGTGEIWVSYDKGTTWVYFAGLTQRLWCIASGNDKFVISGDAGVIYLIDLRLTWSDKAPEADYVWYRFKVLQNDGSIVYSDAYNDKIPRITYDETTNTLNIITE